MQPKRRLSSQPERITSHSYLLTDPFFTLPSVTKLLDDPREKTQFRPLRQHFIEAAVSN